MSRPLLAVVLVALFCHRLRPQPPEQVAREEALKSLIRPPRDGGSRQTRRGCRRQGRCGAAVGEAMKALGGLAGAAGGGSYEPVDFRKLKGAAAGAGRL